MEGGEGRTRGRGKRGESWGNSALVVAGIDAPGVGSIHGLGGLFSNFVWVGLGSDLRRNCCYNLFCIFIGLLSQTFDLH